MVIDPKGKVSIMGCGWLGLPLAIALIKQGYVVRGSTTSKAKLEKLFNNDIHPHRIVVSDAIQGDVDGFFDSQLLIVNIPPGRRKHNVESEHPRQIELVLDQATKYRVPHVIFISSTGVYKNTFGLVDETSILEPSRPSGKALVKAEKIIQSYRHQWTILRMSGLVGGSRQPGNWFEGKVDVPGGNTPVNMVHRDDCIRAIQTIIEFVEGSDIYNICADKHPVKRVFYTAQSNRMNTLPPIFLDGILPHKVIDNQKFKKRFRFAYEHPDPVLF